MNIPEQERGMGTMRRRAGVVVVLVALLASAALAGCRALGDNQKESPTNEGAPIPVPDGNLKPPSPTFDAPWPDDSEGQQWNTLSMRGVISKLETAKSGGSIQALVIWTEDASVGEATGITAAQVAITPETVVERVAKSGEKKRIGVRDLRVSDIVEVWFGERARDSYPVQVDAVLVRVTGRYTRNLPKLIEPDSGNSWGQTGSLNGNTR